MHVCVCICVSVSFASMVTIVSILTLGEIKYSALEDSFFEDKELETY